MRIVLITVFSVLAGMVLWAALVITATLNGWGQRPLAPTGDARAFMEAAVEEIETNMRGNVAFILIEDGRIFDEYYASVGRPVDRNTLFQVASLSKWITAYGVMKLVEKGRIDLDAPVSTYLTRWELPPSEFDNSGVTVRRLLSHTAGLTDGLGYAGFAPGSDTPSLKEALAHPKASQGTDGVIRVGYEPGTKWQYSGGGYAILQLVVEEATGGSFNDYMRRAVFEPLGMERSTFVLDENETNLAISYDIDGTPGTLYRFTVVAATSLYTSAADMTRFVLANMIRPNRPARGGLKAETLEQMREPHGSQMGADIWGLGTMLYAPDGHGDFVIGHDGKNEPAINTAVRLNPATHDAIVLLETGNPLLATKLAGSWVFWQTGNVGFLAVTLAADRILKAIIIGWTLIVLAGLVVAWKLRRRAKGHA